MEKMKRKVGENVYETIRQRRNGIFRFKGIYGFYSNHFPESSNEPKDLVPFWKTLTEGNFLYTRNIDVKIPSAKMCQNINSQFAIQNGTGKENIWYRRRRETLRVEGWQLRVDLKFGEKVDCISEEYEKLEKI